MMKRKIKGWELGLLLIFGFSFSLAEEKPHIIYLMSDDQNFESVGCYGNSEVVTPNMDQLGRDGVIFDRHYNTTSICMASRANVMTGMYEYKTGTNFTHGNMKPETWVKSYPVLLREAGYFTAFAGKFGFEVEGKGPNGKAGMCEDDFDMWGGAPGQTSFVTAKNQSMAKYAKAYPHSTLSYGAFAKDAIEAALEQNKPLCLSISFKAAHKPADPDPQFDHIYEGNTFTRPENFGRENGAHFAEQSKQGRQYPRFTEWKYDTDYDGEMAKYYQQVYGIDVALGMIRGELEKLGIADNTVIIYTSDNGYICGAHGYGSKVLPMEESARVPLMIYDPRSASAGKELRCAALTGNIDFAPTILELAGLPVPENMDGVSLRPLLEDPTGDVRETLTFMNLFDAMPTRALTVLTKEAKYTYWWYGDDKMKPVEELFHLKRDPLEMTNLVSNPEAAPLLEEMRKNYDAAIRDWKEEAVPYNDYQQYGVLFDRSVPWDQKSVKPKASAGKKKPLNAEQKAERRKKRAESQ
ncbi:MAG: sulfatase [Verrucomicrobiales bacterium]|nr:sulfatase [Verrucomicrobiales bacterium]